MVNTAWKFQIRVLRIENKLISRTFSMCWITTTPEELHEGFIQDMLSTFVIVRSLWPFFSLKLYSPLNFYENIHMNSLLHTTRDGRIWNFFILVFQSFYKIPCENKMLVTESDVNRFLQFRFTQICQSFSFETLNKDVSAYLSRKAVAVTLTGS